MFLEPAKEVRPEQSCQLPDVRTHRAQESKHFLAIVEKHLSVRPSAPAPLPESLDHEMQINQQLIAFASFSPKCGQRLLSMLCNYCISRALVDNRMASAIFKVARELNTESKVRQIENLSKSAHFFRNRDVAGKLISLVLLSTKNDRELISVIKKASLLKIENGQEVQTTKARQLDPYLDYFKVRRAFCQIAKPAKLSEQANVIAIKKKHDELKAYINELKGALFDIPNIKSRWIYKLYVENLNSAKKEVKTLFAGAASKKECIKRVNNFMRELTYENRLAISLERKNQSSTKRPCKAPRWDTKRLNAVESLIDFVPAPLLIFTDRLKKIVIMDHALKKDRLAERDTNGILKVFCHTIDESVRSYIYGRYQEFKTSLLHEAGHGLHLRKSRAGNYKEIYSPESKLNAILQNELFMRSMKWKMLEPSEFILVQGKNEVIIAGETYPLQQQTEYKGQIVTFHMTRDYGATNVLVYQAGGELYHDAYGSSSPTEHYTTALCAYFLMPEEFAQKYPTTFIYFEQQFRRYKNTELFQTAVNVIEQKAEPSFQSKGWCLELPSGISLSSKSPDAKSELLIKSTFFDKDFSLTFEGSPENKKLLQDLLLETMGTKLPKGPQTIYLVERLIELQKSGALVSDNSQLIEKGFLSALCDRILPQLSLEEASQIIKIQRVKKSQIYQVTAPTESMLCFAMLRFQEYYESPQFEGQFFTRQEFQNWYAEKFGSEGQFTYYEDWAGFNFTREVVRSLNENRFSDLTTIESYLLSEFTSIGADRYYVLGVASNETNPVNLGVLNHEIAHALWYLNEEYRELQEAQLEKFGDLLNKIKTKLKKMGYAEGKLLDECHAYLLDGPENIKHVFSIKMSKGEVRLTNQMLAHFEEFKLQALSGK